MLTFLLKLKKEVKIMKKLYKAIFILYLFTGFFFQLIAIEIYKKEETALNLGFKNMFWIQSVEDAAPDTTKMSTDFAVKQFRLYTGGQVTQYLKFGGILDFNDIGDVDGKEGSAKFTLTDAWMNFYLMPEFQIMIGKFRAPFSRWALTDAYTAFPLPHSPFASLPSFVTHTGDYRQIGVTLWGIIKDKFRYNIGVSDKEPKALLDEKEPLGPQGESDPQDRPQYLLRAEFSPIGEDKGYVHLDQWLGKKKLFTLGIGYTEKKYDAEKGEGKDVRTYNAFTVDAYAEFPLPDGSAIIGEAAYFLYDKDTKENPKIESYFIQAGYLLPIKIGVGQFQVTMRFEEVDPDGDKNNGSSFAFGINYYLKGHDAKIMIEYLKVDNEKEAKIYSGLEGKDRDAITFLFQFQI